MRKKRKYLAKLKVKPTLSGKDKIDAITKEITSRKETAIDSLKEFVERDTTGTQRPHGMATKEGLRYSEEIDEQFKNVKLRYESVRGTAESSK